MATASELAVQLTTKREEHTTWLESFKKGDGYDMPAEKVGEFHTRNDELATLQKSWETATEVEKSAEITAAKLAPQGTLAANKGGDTIEDKGSRWIKDADGLDRAFKSAWGPGTENHAKLNDLATSKTSRGTVTFELPIQAKTLVTLADHYPVPTRAQTTMMPYYFGDVEDLYAHGTTNANAVEYFIQTTDTVNAATVAEGSAVTDSVYVWTKTSDEVETIQSWIPVTREFLNDNSGMQSMVTGRLALELQQEFSQQILSGTGTTPQLWGAFIRVGFQTQAKALDPVFDAVGKAILKVQVTGDATPDAIVMHPTDWWNLRLTRTTDGIYILGNPADAVSPSLFGLPVRLSIGIGSAGTAGVGAFRTYAQIWDNGGVVVEASTEHSTYFTERKVALAVHRRASLVSYRPSAFCTVTGL